MARRSKEGSSKRACSALIRPPKAPIGLETYRKTDKSGRIYTGTLRRSLGEDAASGVKELYLDMPELSSSGSRDSNP